MKIIKDPKKLLGIKENYIRFCRGCIIRQPRPKPKNITQCNPQKITKIL